MHKAGRHTDTDARRTVRQNWDETWTTQTMNMVARVLGPLPYHGRAPEAKKFYAI